MVSDHFVEYWARKYNSDKYPEQFYKDHLVIVRKAGASNLEIRDALVALLHWKDGKANSYKPGVVTAKPNTVSNLPYLNQDSLCEFIDRLKAFRDAEYLENHGQSFYNYLTGDEGLWQSTVIPVFVLHCARPIDIPIVDQHVCRAQAILLGNYDSVCRVVKSWDQYLSYVEFWKLICEKLILTSFEQKRQLDLSLWAFGEHWKDPICQKDDSQANKHSTRRKPVNANSSNKGVHLTRNFAVMCYELYVKGYTQEESIRMTCRKFGVSFESLPAMYSDYPGRGFNEWRSKGWIPG